MQPSNVGFELADSSAYVAQVRSRLEERGVDGPNDRAPLENAPGIVVAEEAAMPQSPRQPLRPRLHVTIVSDNAETLDGLETYLQRAGLTTNGTRRLDKACEMTPPACTVVLLFPDDFRSAAVVTALTKLASQRPEVLRVLVTREPRCYELLPTPTGAITPLIVPKPSFGWTILDAIRARLESEAVKNEKRQ
jgi:hypothetical protein